MSIGVTVTVDGRRTAVLIQPRQELVPPYREGWFLQFQDGLEEFEWIEQSRISE